MYIYSVPNGIIECRLFHIYYLPLQGRDFKNVNGSSVRIKETFRGRFIFGEVLFSNELVTGLEGTLPVSKWVGLNNKKKKTTSNNELVTAGNFKFQNVLGFTIKNRLR